MILLLIAIIVFLIWNNRVNLSDYVAPPVANDGTVPVPPDVIQGIIEKIQQSKPDEYPLETLFITPQADGSYSSRFMFYNTRKFLGTQYDVTAKVRTDGNVDIINITASAKEDKETGFKPDTYKPYADVETSSTNQLKSILATRPETPVETDMRLGTRS